MTQELLYTSAPKGLKSGSRGFCTVDVTPDVEFATVPSAWNTPQPATGSTAAQPAYRLAAHLIELTGESFGTNVSAWQAWHQMQ